MSIALHYCSDVSDYALRLSGWQQEFDQLDGGHFTGEIVDVSGRGVRLFRERANLSVSQRMHFPDDQWHLVMPLYWPDNPSYRSDVITVLPHCNEFLSTAPAGYDLLVFSIDCARCPWLEQSDRRMRMLHVDPSLLEGVRQYWRSTTEHLQARQEALRFDGQEALLLRLEDSIDQLLGSPSSEIAIDSQASYRTRRYIVDRCHALTRARPDNPPTLMELCHQLRISRRTLQYSFQSETGQSPVSYLRALRLNAVRRTLLLEPALPLADAAARQGFFHPSYFSREYQRLFHELPSVTHKRSRQA